MIWHGAHGGNLSKKNDYFENCQILCFGLVRGMKLFGWRRIMLHFPMDPVDIMKENNNILLNYEKPLFIITSRIQ